MTIASHDGEEVRFRSRRYYTGIGCAIGAAFFLSGNNTALAVYETDGGSVPAMMFFRYACYVVVVGFACQATGAPLRLVEGEQGSVRLIGSVYAVGMLSLLTSFTLINVSLAVLVLYTFPLFTTLLTACLNKQFPGVLLLGCLLVALAGLAIALEVHNFNHNPFGIAAATCTSVCFATTFVLSERWLPHLNPMALSFHISVPGLVIMFFVYAGYLLFRNIGSPGVMQFGLPEFGSSGSFGLVISVIYYMIAMLMMFRAIQDIGGSSTAMAMNLEPVFTLVMVTVFLAAPFTFLHVVGALIVIGAVLLAQLSAVPAGRTVRDDVQ